MVCLRERLFGTVVALPKLHSDGSLETEAWVGRYAPLRSGHVVKIRIRAIRTEASYELRKRALREAQRHGNALLDLPDDGDAVAETPYRDRLDRLSGKDMARGIQAVDADVLQGTA